MIKISNGCISAIRAIPVLAAFAFMNAGNAAIIPTLDSSTPTAKGPDWVYNYTGKVQEDASLDSTDSFFTIYDVGDASTFVTAEAPPGWSWTSQAAGKTPSHINAASFDSGLINVTFVYNGAATQPGGSPVPISGFQIVSKVDAQPKIGWYAGQANLGVGPAADTQYQFVGHVRVPGIGSTSDNGSNDPHGSDPAGDPDPSGNVPEPVTSLLLAGGLFVLGIGARHKRQGI